MKLHHIKQEITEGEIEIEDPAHILEEIEYLPNKPYRDDVIEYNPEELSREDSEHSGRFSLFNV